VGESGWSCLSSEERFRSSWFVVRRDRARRPDGSLTDYDHVVAPPAVTVLAIDGRGLVAVTRQWIYAHGETQWRLPAGRVDDGESPVVAAARELREETGARAARLVPLGAINCADSLTNHRDHGFLATELTNGPHELEAGESDLEVHWLSFDRVLELVLAGEMPHAGSTFSVLSARVKGLVG